MMVCYYWQQMPFPLTVGQDRRLKGKTHNCCILTWHQCLELSVPLRLRWNIDFRQVFFLLWEMVGLFFVIGALADTSVSCFSACLLTPRPGCKRPSRGEWLWHWQSYLRPEPSVIASGLAWAIAQSTRLQWTLSPRKPLNNLFMIREAIAWVCCFTWQSSRHWQNISGAVNSSCIRHALDGAEYPSRGKSQHSSVKRCS